MSDRPLAPGWYPDPTRVARERYHDGRTWTDQARGEAPDATRPRRRTFRWSLLVVVLLFVGAGIAWATLVPDATPDESDVCDALEPVRGLPAVPASIVPRSDTWPELQARIVPGLARRAETYAAAAAVAEGTRRDDLEALATAYERGLRTARALEPLPDAVLAVRVRLVDTGAAGVAIARFQRSTCGWGGDDG